MTDTEWFKLFDETNYKFLWFFVDYGHGEVWDRLVEERANENREMMIELMNIVWFLLPDGRFNIMENPDGWSEFLNLIEE